MPGPTGRSDRMEYSGAAERNCLDPRPHSIAGLSIAAVSVVLITPVPIVLITATPRVTPILICVLARELVITLGVLGL